MMRPNSRVNNITNRNTRPTGVCMHLCVRVCVCICACVCICVCVCASIQNSAVRIEGFRGRGTLGANFGGVVG